MKTFLLTLLTGTVFGIVDILPMIKMKLEHSAILSAFVFYLIVPFIIYNTDIFGATWWLKGGVITLLLALPIIIIVAKDGIKAAAPIAVMSVVLGTLIGVVGKFVIKVL
jgi:hypothetical protein